jgi:hypothetical protein
MPPLSLHSMVQEGREELADFARTWAVDHAAAERAPATESVPESPPAASGA